MSAPSKHHAMRRTVDGTVWVFLAEALILPTGLITTVFLTARLGTTGYGAFTLAATIIAWIEWTIASVFTRPTIKFIGEAVDWKPVGSAVVRQYLLVSAIATLFVCALSIPAGQLLHEPALARYLCLFALDIPIFGLAQAHRNILIGIGSFRRRAVSGASRWIARLIFIVVLVEMGWSVEGAIVASILASCVELAVGRAFIKPSFRLGIETIPSFWGYATPLLVSVLSLRLYEKLDLFLLKALGGSTAEAGIYGAAQNLAIIPGIFAMSFTPLVLATITRLMRDGLAEDARRFARHAMRLVVLSLGFAAIASGSADEIVGLIYQDDYAPAGGPLAALMVGAWGMVVVATASAILIAYGRPRWVLAITLPLVPVTFVAHLLAIPAYHAAGAAWVTGLAGVACAVGFVVAGGVVCGAAPAFGTFARALVVAAVAYWASVVWHADGAMVVAKIVVLCLGVIVAIPLTGELSRSDWDMFFSLIPWRSPAVPKTEAG